MKKHVITILLAALLLTACIPTPSEPIVLQKDQDLMIKKGSATLPPDETYLPPEVPERYRFDYQDGMLTIRADAEVVVPSVPMPIVNIRAQGISQETMYRLFNLLSNGEELLLPHRRTKTEIEEEIKSCNDLLSQKPPEHSDLSQEEYEYGLRLELEQLQEEYKTAPDTDGARVSDGTYETMYDRAASTEFQYLEARNNRREIVAFMYKNADHGSQLRYNQRLNGFEGYSEMHTIPYDETVALEGMQYENAAACVQEFLDAVGEPFEIAAVYRIDDAMDGSTDGTVKDAERVALRFDCRRIVNGIPLAVNASSTGYSDESSYSISWRQEILQIVADADGIVSVYWGDPLTLTGTVAESTNLMPFEKIRGIAEKMMPIVFNPAGWNEDTTIDIQIRSVRLELIRIREQFNTDELKGMLVPVWLFYGTAELTTNYGKKEDGTDKLYRIYTSYGMRSGSDYYRGEEVILCINAIDGTIIDPLLGY